MTLTLSQVTPELVTRAADGDRRALEDIARALERPLFNVARKMLLDPQDAEDAAQEALVRIITHLGQYRAEARFSTWAWRVAVRRILDFREQRAAAARLTFDGFRADLHEGLAADAPERAEDAVLHRQIKNLCSRALLHCLDGDHRIAYILGDILELPSQEAAEILEIEPAALRKRLSRARAQLGDFLGRYCGMVNPAAPCACHRRVDRALALGRVRRDAAPPATLEPEPELVTLRAQIHALKEAERVSAYYRSDPDLPSRRDFVATVRSLVATSTRSRTKEPS